MRITFPLPLNCRCPFHPSLAVRSPLGSPGHVIQPLQTLLSSFKGGLGQTPGSSRLLEKGRLDRDLLENRSGITGAPKILGSRGVTRSGSGKCRVPGRGASYPRCGRASLSRSLPRASSAASWPAKSQLSVFVPEKLSAAARTEHARRRGGPGVRKPPQVHGASHFGVAHPGRAMGWAGVPGRATWVLAGGVLATALALPAGPGGRPWPPSGPGPIRRPRGAQDPLDPPAAPVAAPERTSQYGDAQGTSGSGVIFQKCAVVSGQSTAQTAQVRLLVNNSQTPDAANLSDLVLLDNVTGLTIWASPGNKTSAGFQAFRKQFLPVGDAFLVSYTAALEAGGVGSGARLLLPALLSFESSSPNRTQLKALFTITAEEKIKVLPNHGLHVAGFFVAFIVSLVLAWVTLSIMGRYQCWKGSVLTGHQVQHHESKLEHSQFTSADGVNEDLALNDHMVDILFSEDPGGMLQALEELEIATLNRADVELEACRTQISKDVIALLLSNLASSGHLSTQVERRMGAVFKKQFLSLEREIREELDRKMVALTAECDLETRKKTENQYQREVAATEEAEELLKRVSERSAAECSASLRALHGLELGHLRRSLALQKEEDFARARRQLAVFQRSELHNIFFAQIKSAIFKGELKPEAAKMLLQDYCNIQEDVEELMDYFQASKRYHLSKRFGHREYLVQNIQSSETRVQGLLSAAAAQLTLLIQKHERAGYLDEGQTEVLLERAQTEVFSVKQKLDSDLKQEKKKLRQKLITRRRREMLQKHKEQRKEQLSLGDAFRAAEDVSQYLGQWRSLVAGHIAALEELQECLDQAALDGLRALTLSLSQRAAEELWRLQNSAVAQELLRRGAPWLFLQQVLEEHSKETAARAEQLEAEERDRDQEGVQSVRQRLKEDDLEAATEEQAELRRWQRCIFARLCSTAFSLSEEELLRVRRDVHGCFAQMDRSLALPRIRARVLLQQLHTAWREAEFQKVDQAPAAPELQQQSKARKSCSKSKSKIDLLKKRLKDKIQLFEEQAPEDLVEKVRGELLRERVQQLEAQEGRFAESLVSLQFQKAARMAETLGASTALLSIQDLLLEELSESETLTRSACVQILESHSSELQELERKLEDALGHQETAQLQRALDSQQRWAGSQPGLLNEPEDADSERQVSTVLLRALSRSHRLLEHHQQSLREERESSAVLEDLLENMEMDTFATLYSQELRLASYLSRLTMVPAGVLHRLLSVALPAASQPELLAMLDAVGQKHADHAEQSDSRGEQADPGRRRKHQGWWQALESKLRGELISEGLEKMLWARRKKESILKKTCPPLRERVAFSGEGHWPHLSLEPLGELAPVSIVGAETVDLLNTGEKLFIFRNPREPEISLHVPPRRKKKNFLNARKAAWALGMD